VNLQPHTIGLVTIAGLLVGCVTQQVHLTDQIFLEQVSKANIPLREFREIYPDGLRVTKHAEGFRKLPYDDAASYCTIGYGHLIHFSSCNGSEEVRFVGGITEEVGTELLMADMRFAEAAVQQNSPIVLSDGQYAALCDFVYNVGGRAYGTSTLKEVVNEQKWDLVPHELLRWVRIKGKESDGLHRRRESEIKLFFDGIPMGRSEQAAPLPEELIDIELGEHST
jgi:lysozyme